MTVPRLCAFCRDMSRSWDQDLVDRYLEVFGVPGETKVRKLSKGQEAQLQLCLALGSDPEVLILDEPTSGLDPVARRAYLKVLPSATWPPKEGLSSSPPTSSPI